MGIEFYAKNNFKTCLSRGVLSSVWLYGLPIPPSLNNAYPSVNGRRVQSKELHRWKVDMMEWALINRASVKELRNEFEFIPKGHTVAVNCVYYFKRERVLTKKGDPKRLDVDNRLKVLLDQVTELIGIDDCMIWQGSFWKRIAPDKEHCDVELVIVGPKAPDAQIN